MELSKAIQKGFTEQVRRALEGNADPNSENSVLLAVSRSNPSILRLLIKYGADVNGNNKKGAAGSDGFTTPLTVAIDAGNEEIVRILVDAGADVNVQVDGGYPIHYAVTLAEVGILSYLLNKGALMDVINGEGNTCLHVACHHGNLAAVRTILSYFISHADAEAVTSFVNRQNNTGISALHLAVQSNDAVGPALVTLLLQWNGDIYTRDKDGDTPMHIIAAEGKVHIARLLLQHAGNESSVQPPPILSEENNSGWSPLFCSAASERAEMMDFLIRRESDMFARDRNGQTVLDWCLKNKSVTCTSVLLRHLRKIMDESEFRHLAASISSIVG